MKNKLKTAITGNIGSGKSSFCRLLEEKGFPVIKADEVSKEILVKNKSVKEKIIREFGKESFINNEINKKFLAEKVFSDPYNVIKINSIIHPEVIKKTEKLMDEKLKANDIVFVEAALIYEAEMEAMFDYVVLITADEKIRCERKTKWNNLTSEEFIKRNNNQIPDEEKKKQADFVFENNGTREELSAKVDLLITLLKGLQTSS